MQTLLLKFSNPFVQLMSLFIRRNPGKSVSAKVDAKAKTNKKVPSVVDINAAIIKAWYAPTTSEQIYYFDSDCIKNTPMTFPNIATN